MVQSEKKEMNICGFTQLRSLILAHITGTYSLYSISSDTFNEKCFEIQQLNRRINFLHQLYEDLAEAELEEDEYIRKTKLGIIQLTLFNKFKRT